jgi:hypothetical protein
VDACRRIPVTAVPSHGTHAAHGKHLQASWCVVVCWTADVVASSTMLCPALHVIASCPEPELVQILQWIHAHLGASAARYSGTGPYAVTIFTALLPAIFADPRCQSARFRIPRALRMRYVCVCCPDTIIRYILANGLHLDGSPLLDALRSHASPSKRASVLLPM